MSLRSLTGALLLLVGCMRAPKRIEPPPSDTPACVRLTVRDGRDVVPVLVCVDHLKRCRTGRQRVIDNPWLASLGNVREIGQCKGGE